MQMMSGSNTWLNSRNNKCSKRIEEEMVMDYPDFQGEWKENEFEQDSKGLLEFMHLVWSREP